MDIIVEAVKRPKKTLLEEVRKRKRVTEQETRRVNLRLALTCW